ncbi:MAG: sugar ABC transporter permease [Spirochaetaceae bacterium]|nr:MAG: sugar ABC transporter permease [Spirochaetaceae bacterium]
MGLQTDLGRRHGAWLLMTLPAVLWIVVFRYVTLVGLGIAFIDYRPRRGIFGSDFVGLRNFEFLFRTEAALRATRNTVLLSLLFLVVSMVVALAVAYMIYQIYSSRMTKYYQTVLLLPNFISWVIVSYFVFALLATESGIVNVFLRNIGRDPIAWYSSPQYWPFILLMAHMWNSLGWSSLIYLAAMLGIDPQLYEAATLDGANKFKQFFSVTIPLILPIVTLNFLLGLGNIFAQDFGLFYQVTRNRPQLYPTTDVLDTFIYRSIAGLGNIPMASAAQFYQSVVGFVLILTANWLIKRTSRSDQDLSIF